MAQQSMNEVLKTLDEFENIEYSDGFFYRDNVMVEENELLKSLARTYGKYTDADIRNIRQFIVFFKSNELLDSPVKYIMKKFNKTTDKPKIIKHYEKIYPDIDFIKLYAIAFQRTIGVIHHGHGGNGKSILGKFIYSCFKKFKVPITTNQLKEKFNLSYLLGRYIAYGDDISDANLNTVRGLLKSLMTQGEALFEKKGKEAVFAKVYATLVMNTNPEISETLAFHDTGMVRRFFQIDFSATEFETFGNDIDDLIAEWYTDEEREKFLNCIYSYKVPKDPHEIDIILAPYRVNIMEGHFILQQKLTKYEDYLEHIEENKEYYKYHDKLKLGEFTQFKRNYKRQLDLVQKCKDQMKQQLNLSLDTTADKQIRKDC